MPVVFATVGAGGSTVVCPGTPGGSTWVAVVTAGPDEEVTASTMATTAAMTTIPPPPSQAIRTFRWRARSWARMASIWARRSPLACLRLAISAPDLSRFLQGEAPVKDASRVLRASLRAGGGAAKDNTDQRTAIADRLKQQAVQRHVGIPGLDADCPGILPD